MNSVNTIYSAVKKGGDLNMCRLVMYKNGQYIADIKYNYIENIAKQAEKCRNISKIILFGSSIEERCTDESDIDIAVFGSLSKSKYLRSKEFKKFQDELFMYDLNQDYDILYFCENDKSEDAIMNDINQGTEIYRSGTYDFDKESN